MKLKLLVGEGETVSALFMSAFQDSAQSFLPSEGSVELCGTEHKILKAIGPGGCSTHWRWNQDV